MSTPTAPAGLPRVHTPDEVAQALASTEHYVKRKARSGDWPHLRLARGAIGFTADQVAQILAICTRDADSSGPAKPFLTPQSQRSLAKKRRTT